jgi:hypothetical protein
VGHLIECISSVVVVFRPWVCITHLWLLAGLSKLSDITQLSQYIVRNHIAARRNHKPPMQASGPCMCHSRCVWSAVARYDKATRRSEPRWEAVWSRVTLQFCLLVPLNTACLVRTCGQV